MIVPRSRQFTLVPVRPDILFSAALCSLPSFAVLRRLGTVKYELMVTQFVVAGLRAERP
jgi:hypothetical protein